MFCILTVAVCYGSCIFVFDDKGDVGDLSSKRSLQRLHLAIIYYI